MHGRGGRHVLDLHVNGKAHAIDLPADTLLLSVLRNDLHLTAAKYGCGLGECGACTVLIDGLPARACIVPLAVAAGRPIETLEGLGTAEHPHPVQRAFIEAQAAQCGYCLAGMIMTVKALLDREHDPDDATIRRELAGNLCRCGTHIEILAAAHRAAALMREARG